MGHSSISNSTWTRAWKGFLPARAIVMVRKPSPITATLPTPNPLGPHAHPNPNELNQVNSSETLELISAQLAGCMRCNLCEKRKSVVLGEGNPHAELVFIGESPGEQEDLQGRPFVGEAGQLLDKMIQAMGLKRHQVYLTNVVKCRPPDDRTPEPGEIRECSPFLARQLAQIQPKIIVALGKQATQTLLHSEASISELRGKFHPSTGAGTQGNSHNAPQSSPHLLPQIMPTFDPAYLLKNPASKREVWSDLQQVAKALGIEIPKR